MKVLKYFIIALAIIVIDQTSKLLVYHNMELNTEFNVLGDWFRIHYLLNPGMAFGIRWESEYGKLALTLFRLVAMFGISYYLILLYKRSSPKGLLICMALILGGAVGNLIDSVFYGVFLDNAPLDAPTPWFHGQVIDMLYFPLFEGFLPEWLPIWGGDYFLFFSPVFNIADSSIFMGVLFVLIFQKRYFPKPEEEKSESSSPDQVITESAEMNQEGQSKQSENI